MRGWRIPTVLAVREAAIQRQCTSSFRRSQREPDCMCLQHGVLDLCCIACCMLCYNVAPCWIWAHRKDTTEMKVQHPWLNRQVADTTRSTHNRSAQKAAVVARVGLDIQDGAQHTRRACVDGT